MFIAYLKFKFLVDFWFRKRLQELTSQKLAVPLGKQLFRATITGRSRSGLYTQYLLMIWSCF